MALLNYALSLFYYVILLYPRYHHIYALLVHISELVLSDECDELLVTIIAALVIPWRQVLALVVQATIVNNRLIYILVTVISILCCVCTRL